MKKPVQLRKIFLCTGLATLVLAGCASPPPPAYVQPAPVQYERGVLLQRIDAVIANAQNNGSLRLATSPDPLVTGQTLQLELATAQPGYLYLYQVATDGRTLSLVFPNAIDGANYMAAGSTRLPRANWQLKAYGPAGTGYLLAVLTPQALNTLAMQADAPQGRINLPAPYSAALASLREVAAP
ncbi:MAG: DUF4384 domain-containing protein [Pseudomonadota bacterium]